MKKLHASRRRGFTIVEMAVAMTIFAVLATSVAMSASEGRDAYKLIHQNSSLESRLREGTGRIVRSLMATGQDVIAPDPTGQFGTSTLDFQVAVGINGDLPAWGPLSRMAFEYAPGELDDGIDNDGNGLVDDGMVVLTRDPGGAAELRVVLVRGVSELLEGETLDGTDENGNGVIDEAGFNIHREGNVLTVRLTLEDASNQAGTLARTLTTGVRLRN